MSGIPWTDRWWGGTLADGTVIVTNPDVPAEGIVDLTATPETTTPVHEPEPDDGLMGWLNERPPSAGRVPVAAPVEGGRVYVPPMRSSTLIVGACVLAGLVLFFVLRLQWWLLPLLLVVGYFAGQAAMNANEWRKIDPRKMLPVSPSDRGDPLTPLRYVETEVSVTEQWARMTAVADALAPPDWRSQDIHLVLWAAADVHPDIESRSLGLAGSATMERLARQAESLIEVD